MNTEFTQQFFEESSKAWKTNKVKYGQSMYRYKKNAFVPAGDLPKQRILTRAQTKAMEQESLRRSQIDEPVPPRVRRSARLARLASTH
jgi:hypothetical protein